MKNLTIAKSSFIKKLITQVQKKNKKIILVEGEDLRVITAANYCQKKRIANITLLGDANKIEKVAKKQKVILKGVEIISPQEKNIFSSYTNLIEKLPLKKQTFLQENTNKDLSLACLKLLKKEVDGVVCGAVYSTNTTLKSAFKLIGLKQKCRLISSLFIMLVKKEVLFFSDCAVNISPNSDDLKDIANNCLTLVKDLKVKPRVAFLSYSTGESGKGEKVTKVKEAYSLFKKSHPNIPSEGPIQFDAAIDPKVAKQKIKNSELKGKANTFIFPDLDSGNITYKAVQRLTGALAIGPILQGLQFPFNDLSRGASVEDIILTILLTATQSKN